MVWRHPKWFCLWLSFHLVLFWSEGNNFTIAIPKASVLYAIFITTVYTKSLLILKQNFSATLYLFKTNSHLIKNMQFTSLLLQKIYHNPTHFLEDRVEYTKLKIRCAKCMWCTEWLIQKLHPPRCDSGYFGTPSYCNLYFGNRIRYHLIVMGFRKSLFHITSISIDTLVLV